MSVTVNGITHDADAIAREAQRYTGARDPQDAARRALAVRELLLQRAVALGLGRADEGADQGRAEALIAQLLDLEVSTPAPTEAECRRHYDTHPDQFTSGELIEARHILIAVTPGAPVALLRTQAEALLRELQADPAAFGQRAREASNCPSGQHGGNLGQFGRGQMVPEFDKALFAGTGTGVLPRLVQSRYGFHIVQIERRIAGRLQPFASVQATIARYLAARVQAQALQQYVRVLAARAAIDGVDLDPAPSPLLQ
jgi:peptidyl-prolyl cis-trans isomerase C